MRTHYDALGVPQEATEDQIRKAYLKLSLKYHPDKNPGANKEEAEAKFVEIANAYEIIGDPEKRRAYDRDLSSQRASSYSQSAGFGNYEARSQHTYPGAHQSSTRSDEDLQRARRMFSVFTSGVGAALGVNVIRYGGSTADTAASAAGVAAARMVGGRGASGAVTRLAASMVAQQAVMMMADPQVRAETYAALESATAVTKEAISNVATSAQTFIEPSTSAAAAVMKPATKVVGTTVNVVGTAGKAVAGGVVAVVGGIHKTGATVVSAAVQTGVAVGTTAHSAFDLWTKALRIGHAVTTIEIENASWRWDAKVFFDVPDPQGSAFEGCVEVKSRKSTSVQLKRNGVGKRRALVTVVFHHSTESAVPVDGETREGQVGELMQFQIPIAPQNNDNSMVLLEREIWYNDRPREGVAFVA